ncbi:MAG TPA: NAD(P)-binding domain-containing protein, partial [Nocardioides sp.]
MSTTTTKVAFIGLGNMGGPMAAHLVTAGYAVSGFDPSPDAQQAAEAAGLVMAASAAAAAEGADIVLTMLPSGQHVLDVYEGRRGDAPVLGAAAPGALLVDCSTIAVEDARAAADAARAAGYRAADA